MQPTARANRLYADVSPKTARQYSMTLKAHLRTNDGVSTVVDWTHLKNGARVNLRTALRRAGHSTLADSIPPGAPSRHDVFIPPEKELQQIEARAKKANTPKGELTLILLKLGLRAFELTSLPRADVEAAIDSGLLSLMRKRNYRTQVAVKHVVPLFETLLLMPARSGPGRVRGREWRFVSELISRTPYDLDPAAHARAAYATLYRWVKSLTGNHAPHWLRHAFATRLVRNGAPLSVAQQALGHLHGSTTLRYQHATPEDVLQYVR